MVPLVKGFINHQHPQPVTSLEQRRRWRVMGGPNRIEAVRLQQLHAALLGAVN